jgi:hypothetical protein
MLQKLRKFGELSWNEQLLFSEALFFQISVGFLLQVIPFRWIPRLFSGHQSSVGSHKSTLNRKSQIANRTSETSHLTSHISHLIPEQIKTAIQRSGPYSQWKNKCLIQSLAARRMLNRRNIPSQLSLGVAKGANGITVAHAWIKAGDFEIVEKGDGFSELYLF